ncbi:molybdopterin binding domain [Thermosinus carboxydivorans Nor1]|uniref:Molybdopterin molybdenumtransferase n=1 Tax=Thermosinus carboxydivorans Nor1 TaxID=401526 RepID=A1HSF3_9FIRM|nr:molybdopterin-binding protein [Thermosinus carboxydivorans]EAX47018.1 molybdopterin binding domain [Thermosinus carboxydivorans Nor1]
MSIKKVKVEEAVGMVLGHDITKIVPGEYKGPAFKKGHIIRKEDIPHLKNIGKDHIFLIDMAPGHIHENEAVMRMAKAVAGANVVWTEPVEGRVNIKAATDGLLKVKPEAVLAINCIEHAVLSTLHDNRLVRAGDLLAGVKVVPLVVDETLVAAVEEAAREYGPVISVKPLRRLKVGLIITGNEVFYGRIQDRYAPVLIEKLNKFGTDLLAIVYKPDDRDAITAAILDFKQQGADVVIATGGMSVDPDDVTPEAIRAAGAAVVSYGSPVLPGAMFMLAYLDDTAVIGMPACGMYAKTTVFDLVFPRILAGERLSKRDIAALGYGGLCINCSVCSYPHCPFGK